MQTVFTELRSGTIAALADADYEATQTIPDHAKVIPVESTALDVLDDIEIVVRFKDGGGAIIAGTVDIQAIYVHNGGGQAARAVIVGRTPVTGHASGREFPVPGKRCDKFGVRLTNVTAVGATRYEVLWRRNK